VVPVERGDALPEPVASLLPGAGWNLVYKDKRFEVFARPGLALSFRDDSTKDFQGEFP